MREVLNYLVFRAYAGFEKNTSVRKVCRCIQYERGVHKN